MVKVLESLPGIESLTDYTFKYGRNPLLELPLAVNPSGCARSELMERTRVKRVHNFQRTTGKFSKNSYLCQKLHIYFKNYTEFFKIANSKYFFVKISGTGPWVSRID